LRNGAASTQHDEKMSQRGAQTATITTNRTGASAFRKMPVKEFGNDWFVNAPDLQTSATRPLGEVGNAAHATAERVRRVPTLSQVLLVRINVRRERALDKPVDTVES
jgi:hypothetical protein